MDKKTLKSFAELAAALSGTPLESQENRFMGWREKLKMYGILQKPVDDDYRALVTELQKGEIKHPEHKRSWTYPGDERPWSWFYETVLTPNFDPFDKYRQDRKLVLKILENSDEIARMWACKLLATKVASVTTLKIQ